MPQRPEGGMPQRPEGGMPQRPEGEMPKWEGGEMPDFDQGQMTQFPEGEVPPYASLWTPGQQTGEQMPPSTEFYMQDMVNFFSGVTAAE